MTIVETRTEITGGVDTHLHFHGAAAVDANGCCVLPPYHKEPRLLLAITRERIHIVPGSRLAARVEVRSSFARLGLMVHLTAPTIQHGFRGTITLDSSAEAGTTLTIVLPPAA